MQVQEVLGHGQVASHVLVALEERLGDVDQPGVQLVVPFQEGVDGLVDPDRLLPVGRAEAVQLDLLVLQFLHHSAYAFRSSQSTT